MGATPPKLVQWGNTTLMAIPEATAGLQEVITGLGEQEGTDGLLQLARDQG